MTQMIVRCPLQKSELGDDLGEAPSSAIWSKRTSARSKTGLVWVAIVLAACLAPGAHCLSRSENFYIQHWTSRDGLPAGIESITQTVDGALWIGTFYGLARFDGVNFSVFTPQNLPELKSVVVRNISVGPDSQLYLGTDGGLTVFSHDHARSLERPLSPEHPRVTMVLPVGADEVWYGTISGALYHYRHGSEKRVGLGVLPSERVYGLAMASDKTLWIATGGGLFSLSRGIVERYKPETPLPVQQFYDLA